MRLPNISLADGETRMVIALFAVAVVVGIGIAWAALSFLEG